MSGRFGLNLSFCVKRWVTPALWAPLVREDLGVDLVQLSFDLVDPMWPDALLDRQAEAIRRETAAHGVTVHSAFIGLAHYTYSQLLHPEREVRDVAEAWLGRAYRFAALAGIPSAGGPLGAIASRPDGHEADAIDAADYADLLTRMHRLAGVAKGHGLSELYVEPTPMRREWPSTIAQAEQMMADVRAAALPWRYCVDWGHATFEPLYGRYRAGMEGWLERLGDDIGMLHIQQTDGLYDRHWDFTEAGMVEPAAAVALLARTGHGDKPVFLEVFYPFERDDASVLAAVRRSVAVLEPAFAGGLTGVAETLTGARPGGDTTLLRLDELDAERVRARVTWYYYVGGLTQQEIADRLGLTRLKVNRIVGQARADGSVRIEVRLPLADCVALEEALKARYGLTEAVVVPSVGEEDQQRVIGEAAAALLDRLIVGKQSIGVGWGRTLSATVRRLPPRKASGLWVVALMGGLTRGSGTNTFEVSTELTRMLDAECHYLAAPIYCPSVESRATLLTHYGLAEVMRRAREVDIALVSCGDLSPRSNLAATQIVAENAESLRKAGAVGDMLATYFDAEGNPVDHPLNQRVMALPLADLRSIPATVLASGGLHKVPVIRGALAARYVNHLVTDEAVARALL